MIPLAAAALAKSAAGWVAGVIKAVPVRWWLYLAAVVFALWYAEQRADAREATIRAEYEQRMSEEAEQTAQFIAEETARNRRTEQALSDEVTQAKADHDEYIRDLEARQARTVADLASGNFKLRKQWQSCLSRPGQAPETGPGDAGDADLRAADIGRVQGIAGACDAAVKRWQDTWNAAEKAVNGQSGG
jgi:hypothetical protein